MNKKITTIIILIVITCIGGFLRFYKNSENPPGLNGDEISFGYAAYSILTTGRDENNKFLPLVLQSVGDYKNPIPAYLMTIPIAIFGLNDFSVRFPNAFFGTLMIPVFFLFLKDLLKKKSVALLGSFFLAISAWHVYYSRYAYETIIASLFVLLGVWFLMKMSSGRTIWGLLSAFFFSLTMYTAFAPRLFVPLFIFVILLSNVHTLKTNRKKIIIFLLTFIALGLPLLYISLFQGAGTRFSMVFLANDIDFKRYILLESVNNINNAFLLIFFWLKRYLNYLQPDFLFFNGLNMTPTGTFGLGTLYLFDLPFLIVGIIYFIKHKIPYKSFFVIWFFTGIVPDSLTNNQQYAGRLLQIIPVVLLVTTLGAVQFFKWLFSLHKYKKILLSVAFAAIVLIILIHAFLTFAVHFPRAKGESFDEGLREAVIYVHDHQNEYKEIVFDPRRGIEGPFIVSNPYLSVLFYTKYDPHTYQTESKAVSSDKTYFLKFNKYTFRNISWVEDVDKKDTLFIGSPWSLPEKDLKEGELLKKIYLKNGFPAFYIVSPK